MERSVTKLLEQLYGGFLGMNVGIRLGAPVEPSIWTRQRIERVYGDIRGYVKPYKHFAADDDVNGPVFFLRALNDSDGREPTPQSVAEAYLNYTREGSGMFWWGGLGMSTEHTAYLNLINGIKAPDSGSIRQNGKTMAEQIGGQIFIDTWGLVAPGDPGRAAGYARAAASVSHDGEGLNGASFIAACISAAFDLDDIEAVLDRATDELPQDCEYRRVVGAVRDFYRAHPDSSWKDCMKMLEDNWGYDRYPGHCHIIPNAGVCVLAMTYGKGDFSRTVEIATMCGWDTDCNAGNVGTVLGVMNGASAIPDHYRAPINDEIILSGASGYLNVLDIPEYVFELAGWVYRLEGRPMPDEVAARQHPGSIDMDFALPGSTHGLYVTDPDRMRGMHRDGGYEVMWPELRRGEAGSVCLKSMYRRKDFSDERYKPAFAPRIYPGQTVSIIFDYEKWKGESVCLTPFVRESLTGETNLLDTQIIHEDGRGLSVRFAVPGVNGGLIGDIGLEIRGNSSMITYDAGRLVIRRVTVSGLSDYTLKVGKMPEEFQSVLPFAQNRGAWHVENGHISALSIGYAEAWTGNYYMRNVRVTGVITPGNGGSHLIVLRAQGTRRSYLLGFDGVGIAAILMRRGADVLRLAQTHFDWRLDQTYTLTAIAKDAELTLLVDGQQVLSVRDDTLKYGMAGYALYDTGRAEFGDLSVTELP